MHKLTCGKSAALIGLLALWWAGSFHALDSHAVETDKREQAELRKKIRVRSSVRSSSGYRGQNSAAESIKVDGLTKLTEFEVLVNTGTPQKKKLRYQTRSVQYFLGDGTVDITTAENVVNRCIRTAGIDTLLTPQQEQNDFFPKLCSISVEADPNISTPSVDVAADAALTCYRMKVKLPHSYHQKKGPLCGPWVKKAVFPAIQKIVSGKLKSAGETDQTAAAANAAGSKAPTEVTVASSGNAPIGDATGNAAKGEATPPVESEPAAPAPPVAEDDGYGEPESRTINLGLKTNNPHSAAVLESYRAYEAAKAALALLTARPTSSKEFKAFNDAYKSFGDEVVRVHQALIQKAKVKGQFNESANNQLIVLSNAMKAAIDSNQSAVNAATVNGHVEALKQLKP